MDLINTFSVPVPVDQAWEVLTDLERIAPCMPGAELQSIAGAEYRGTVRVKVGPITAHYKGTVVFQEKDEAAHRAVIKAKGRETRGQGNASALVTAQLTEDGNGTTVVVSTDLTISGKAAQFGRGVLADVSAALLHQFVRSLEADVLSAGPDARAEHVEHPRRAGVAPGTTSAAAAGSGGRAHSCSERIGISPPPPPPAAPINLLSAVAVPLAKRVAPVAMAIIASYVLLRRGKRTGRQR